MSSETTYVRQITPEERQRQRIAALEAENAQRKRNEQAHQRAIADLTAQLQAEAKQREAVTKQHSREMQSLRASLSEESRRTLDQMEQAHKQQMSAVQHSLEENLKQRDALYQKLLHEAEERAVETRKHIEDQIHSTNLRIESISSNLQEQIEEVNNALNQSIQSLQGQINRNAASIQNILQREQHSADNALEMLRLAQAMLQMIEETNELNRFVPEEAATMRYNMQELVSRADKLDNAALQSMSLERMMEIKEVQRKCELRKAEYDLLLTDAKVNLAEILNIVHANREIDCYFSNNTEPVKIENDFWSHGKYSELEKKLGELEQELKHCKLTKERIIEIQHELDELRIQEAQISSNSVNLAIESESRLLYLQELIPQLQAQGWDLKHENNGKQCADYVELDWREAFYAYLSDRFGTELFVTVGEDINGRKNIAIRLNDEEMTNERFEEVQKEVRRILGIKEEGTCSCPNHHQIPKIQQLVKHGAAKQLREGKL